MDKPVKDQYGTVRLLIQGLLFRQGWNVLDDIKISIDLVKLKDQIARGEGVIKRRGKVIITNVQCLSFKIEINMLPAIPEQLTLNLNHDRD